MVDQAKEAQWAIRGVVLEIADGVARVRVGDEEEDWYFPLLMISEAACIGDCIWLRPEGNRFQVIEVTPERPNVGTHGFGERLDRLHNDRGEKGDLRLLAATGS